MSSWDPNFFQKEDEEVLEDLGYKQQLLRNLSPIQNFGISFSIIAAPTSVTIFFGYSYATGGPATMIISWIVVSFFSFGVALVMGEIVSALPTSGGPYFWAAMLAPSKYSAFASWVTGWFNFLGLVATNAVLAFSLTALINSVANAKTGYESSPGRDLGICAAVLFSWAFMNTVGRPLIRYLIYVSIALGSLGALAFVMTVLIKAPTHQSASFVFQTFYDGTGDGAVGWSIRASPAYVACIGGIMGLASFNGYDASAHLAEETLRAAWIAPLSIIMAVGMSAISGLVIMISLLFSIQNIDNVVATLYGQPVFQVLIDIFGNDGAAAWFALPIMCNWFCGLCVTLSNSRMVWAFARDSGIPRYFSRIDETNLCPTRAVILCSTFSFMLTLPCLGSAVAMTAATSIGVIGMLISYFIPMFIHLTCYGDFHSKRGPFHLGAASRPLTLISVLWIIFACVVLCLPTSNPVTSQTLNYGPIAVGIAIVWAISSWVIRGRKHFIGPVGMRATAIDTGNLIARLNS